MNKIQNILLIISSVCRHPKIFLICTKTDEASEVLPGEVQSSILSLSSSLIQKVISYNSHINRVSLINQILHTSSANIPPEGDPRKSPQELRDMLTAINNFSAKTDFLIPNSWNTFGEQTELSTCLFVCHSADIN